MEEARGLSLTMRMEASGSAVIAEVSDAGIQKQVVYSCSTMEQAGGSLTSYLETRVRLGQTAATD